MGCLGGGRFAQPFREHRPPLRIHRVYQPESLASFRVARQQDGFITNERVRQIERMQSREAVEVLWAQIARKSPNYSGGTADDVTK
jgi:hypothetical protein